MTEAEKNEALETQEIQEDTVDAPEETVTEDNDLQAQIEKLEAENADMKDKMMRALAEAENTRRRAAKDKEDTSKFAVTKFARDMLGVSDNLQRALDAVNADKMQEDPELKALHDGVAATERELLSRFTSHGVKKLEPMDEKFDPNFHEVMFEAPIPGKEAGTIIQIIEAGYTLNGRLLRPAKVGVAKGDDSANGGDNTPILDEEV